MNTVKVWNLHVTTLYTTCYHYQVYFLEPGLFNFCFSWEVVSSAFRFSEVLYLTVVTRQLGRNVYRTPCFTIISNILEHSRDKGA